MMRWTVTEPETRSLALVFLIVIIGGCARELSPPIRSGEPIGVQFMRVEPSFVGTPFRILLDFESPSDLAFVAPDPAGRIDPAVAHTGGASLQVPPGSAGASVKLGAMVGEGAFPAAWTLAGAYFIAKESTSLTATYEVSGRAILRRTVALEPRKWTAVMLDVSGLNDPNIAGSREVGVLRFSTDRATVWCDDVVLFDNAHFLVGEEEIAGDHWTVRQRGFATLIERPGSFKLSIPTPDAATEGWGVVEANGLRVVLAGDGGKRLRTIYADGHGYLNGHCDNVVNLPADLAHALTVQQNSPAELAVPEEMGRIERNAPGDKNNDGYAEATGSYQIKAIGSRVRVTITPQTARLVRPVLEIANLPKGRVSANMEGQLIEKTERLPNGHVLVEIPLTLTRPTTLDLRVQ